MVDMLMRGVVDIGSTGFGKFDLRSRYFLILG